jgi:hypothetical protein
VNKISPGGRFQLCDSDMCDTHAQILNGNHINFAVLC